MPRLDNTARLRSSATVLLAFYALGIALQTWNGAWSSEFGRYQDEGMHYVTGLMVRDFLATPSAWLHPMPFAKAYYAHFPKVGLGNWPPAFPLFQALWSLPFGVSRPVMLLEVQLFVALTALLVYRETLPRLGSGFAGLAGAMLVASPLTQYVTSMVMAEALLGLLSFLSVLAWIRFQQSQTARGVILFSACTVIAILTKGDAWVVPMVAAAAILMGHWRLLSRRSFWLGAFVIAGVCLPYTWITMRIVRQGWNQVTVPGPASLLASLRLHTGFVVGILGLPLSLIALMGVIVRVLIPAVHRRPVEAFWLVMAIYAAAIVAFHVAVPTSIEPRKVYQIAPLMCLFAVAGLEALAAIFAHGAGGVGPLRWRAAFAVAGALFFALTGFHHIPPFTPGFSPAIRALLARPDTAGEAVLISSNPIYEDAEAALISEWAERRRDAGTYLLRGSKFLSRPDGTAQDPTGFTTFVSTAPALEARLAAVPVAYVLLDTVPAAHPYPHHGLLRATLSADSRLWERIYRTRQSALGIPHEIEIYRFRRDITGVPVRFDVDLSNKIGQTVDVGR
ncbi:MAG: glycosyltransferase family 39 protein [Bryobacteraceae bacterium]